MAAPGTAGLPPDSDQALPTRTFAVHAFGDHVAKSQVPHSTALHSLLDGRRQLTGSLARYAISGRWLSPIALEAARDAGLGDPRQGTVCRARARSSADGVEPSARACGAWFTCRQAMDTGLTD